MPEQPMLSILIPAYNEAEIIAETVRRVHARIKDRVPAHEVVVVSNGSTDGTPALLTRLEQELPFLQGCVLPERGPGRAFVAGLRAARGAWIVTLDADLSSDLVFIEYACDLLRYADMVVGSKSMGRQRRSPVRVLGSQLYLMISSLLFDLTISDYSIGCKAFRREAIMPALGFLDSWTGHVLELALYLHCQDKKIVQIGIDCDDRRSSRFNLLHEGLYRYSHLWRCWRRRRDRRSWFYTAAQGENA